MRRHHSFLFLTLTLLLLLPGCTNDAAPPEADRLEGAAWIDGQAAIETDLLKKTPYDGLFIKANCRIGWSDLTATPPGSSFTEKRPLVVVDPYDAAPLSALLVFNTEAPSSVTVEVMGKTASASFTHAFPGFRAQHQVPIYGLYPGEETRVDLTLTQEDGLQSYLELSLKTAPLPDDFPDYGALLEGLTLPQEGLLCLASADGAFPAFAVDSAGDVRWYSSRPELGGGLFQALSDDGLYLTYSLPVFTTPRTSGGVMTVDRMGKVYEQYLLPGTSDAGAAEDGTLLLTAVQEGRTHLVALDRTVGTWDVLPSPAGEAETPAEGASLLLFEAQSLYAPDEACYQLSERPVERSSISLP